MGPSGCGKSTLLKSLNGISKRSSGNIHLFDLSLDKHFNYFKNQIGYVPQDDVVHPQLTVYQSIYFAAKLRLKNKNDNFIKERINELLCQLKIDKIRNNLNSAISGGQRKRVCIAIELLTHPMLLLLDEPTSPLDPQSIEEFMGILNSLKNENTTIIMVTHKPEDLHYADEVIFLSKDGKLAYKGKTTDYLRHFKVSSTIEVYSKLSSESTWENSGTKTPNSLKEGNINDFKGEKENWLYQLYWLVRRMIKIKTNDKLNTGILILQAPLIAILIGIIFKEISLSLLFMIVISSIWFGVNNASREIVKEKHIFLRESLFNLKTNAYLFSKIISLSLLGIIQTFSFLVILNLFYKFNNLFQISVWFLIINIVSTSLGLLLSSSMKTSDKVLSIVPLVLIPQVMLSGVITKIYNPIIELISYFTFSRWGVEALSFTHKMLNIKVPKVQLNEAGKVLLGSDNLPIIQKETTKQLTSDLLKGQFHPIYDDIFGNLAHTQYLDFIALFILFLLCYIISYRFLRKKIT